MVTQVIVCYHCDSENIVKNGKAPNGKQKYLCHDCGRQSREDPGSNAYSPERREEILSAYQERSSLRGLARTFGVSSRNTVTRWLKKAASLPSLARTLPPAPPPSEGVVLELDELWSFVGKKANKRWVWIALARHTRQVVAYVIGDRSQRTCRRLWQRIPESYKGGSCYYSDFWEAYRAVIPEERHEAVGKESGELAHVERWNNTLRQRLARFVRKTLSFSKSDEMHEACLKLFLHRYNVETIRY
jgi:insertion element IS1 protein InsB